MRRRDVPLSFYLLPQGLWAASHKVRIATGEYPPYVDSRREDQGLASRRLQLALAHVGLQAEFHFMPWRRALYETREGLFDATSYWFTDRSREADFLHSAPVISNELRWVTRRDHALKSGDKVALVSGYTYSPAVRSFIEVRSLVVEWISSDAAGVRMLLLRRVSAFLSDTANICELVQRTLPPEEANELQVDLQGPPDVSLGHVLLPRRSQRSHGLLEQINQGIKATVSSLALEEHKAGCGLLR